MINWKTTGASVVAGLPQIVKIFWPECPPEILNLVTGIGVILMGYFAKDKNVTGGTKQQ